MTLDTGCSEMEISSTLADWLIKRGQATMTGSAKSTLAGGIIRTNRKFIIKEICIDGHVLHDVFATDGAADQRDGSMLLGLGVLKRFGKFSIDIANRQLILG